MNRIDEQAACAANENFYRAIETGDLAALDSIWLHTEWVKCVHPGKGVIIGWEAVRQSWAQSFSSVSYSQVIVTDISLLLADGFACVSCTAEMTVAGGEKSAITTNATNLFQHLNGVWRMLHHHASRVPENKIFTLNEIGEGTINGT